MKLIYRTEIYETCCTEHPAKYRFTENYESMTFDPHRNPENFAEATIITAKLRERLGPGKPTRDMADNPNEAWYYRWTETSIFPGIWMFNIYLTTDEQYTYCMLTFPPVQD